VTILRIIVVAIALALLAWLWRGAVNDATAPMEDAQQALNSLSIAEGALLRDVLSARAGTLRNYDPVVREVSELHEAVQRLRSSMAGDVEITSAVGRLENLIDRQEGWTEQFKTRNALLQNSLAQFGLLSARFRAMHPGQSLDGSVSALAAAMLQLTLDTSQPVIVEVDHRLADVATQAIDPASAATARALMEHARLLRSLLPATDDVMRSLVGAPVEQWQDAIHALVLSREVAAEAMTKRFRYALFATSLLLLGMVAYAGGRLRGHTRTLARRAAFEHIIATLSTRLINSQPHEVRAHVEIALAQLAACLRADRAYFIVRSDRDHVFQWSREGVPMPPGWPQNAWLAASHLDTSEPEIFCSDVGQLPAGPGQDVLHSAGVRGWLYMQHIGGERDSFALGFDAQRGGMLRYPTSGHLLRMMLDAIATALDREGLERQREQLEASLHQARRMETIGALSSGIAHNFNNIVNAILGYTETAQAHVRSSGRVAANLAEIRRAGERARDLIEQILTFGRRKAVRRARISVDILLAEAKSLLDATLPAHAPVVIEGTPSSMMVSAEAAQLQQVIVNVCNNAAQAMDAHGLIRIVVEPRDITRVTPLKQGKLTPGHYVLVSVSDPGRGMEEETLERLFEPFFTTRLEGNGLGLATVREIVLEHGGALDVRSVAGAGTRFEIWLPSLSQAEVKGGRDIPRFAGRGRGETVMVIDTDRARLLRHEEFLAALGYEPVGFTSIDEAAKASASSPERFDAVLLCCHAQGASTVLEHVSALRMMDSHLPIIVASAWTAGFNAPALAYVGIAEVIHQPLASAELAGALARCLAIRARPTLPAHEVIQIGDIYYGRSPSLDRETSM
jgi:signal transduction histidine kinase/FixJ family two-component response regulator